MKMQRLWLILPLLMIYGLSFSQTSTTLGREFYFGYLSNKGLSEDYQMSVHLTADVATSGVLEVLGTGYSQTFTLNANSSLKIDIPDQFRISELAKKEQKVIYVKTEADISAYAYNSLPGSADGSMILPVEALDKEYIVSTWAERPGEGSGRTQFLVLATDDDTEVEITFSNVVEVGPDVYYAKGETITEKLNRGDAILYMSDADLTGTEVKVIDDGTINCKKVAVIAGNEALITSLSSQEPTGDLIFNQLYSLRDWGKEYFIVLHETRFLADPVLVIASEDNTLVEITGVPPQVLDRGETFPFFARVEHYIRADKPISVSHFTSSGFQDMGERGNLEADPFMITLSPLKQVSNDIVFSIIENDSISQHYLSIISTTQSLDMKLDGDDIAGEFQVIDLAPEYSLAVVPVSSGTHRLESKSGAVAHAYGFGEKMGVGYAIGGDLGNFNIEIRNVNSGLPTGQICANDDFELSIESENSILKELYSYFEWDMGDGTILVGSTVNYRYAQPGDYAINLFASRSDQVCSDLNVSRSMEVIGAAIDQIAGPQTICPNVGSVGYQLTGAAPDYTYEWFAEGGTIDSRSGAEAAVTWDTNAMINRLKAISTSPLGCVSDTVFLDIDFKPVLEPIPPLGPSSICGDFREIPYHIPLTTGSVYQWTAVGGQVVSGQGTHEVVVTWNGSGTHELYYSEQSFTQTDLCEGTSAPLAVVVSEEMDITITSQAVSCAGQNDGSASVTVSGGVGPYIVEWAIGVQENSISGLAGGEYEVYISDAVGCLVTRTVRVEEPEPLVGFVIAQDAACSGNTGMATAIVEGGTGNLSYQWTNGYTSNSSISGLAEGNYSVTVRDEAGCELVLNYSIAIPQPMIFSFEEVRPCPNDDSGSLRLNVSGGSPPYQLLWEHDPALETCQADQLTGGSYKVTVTDAEGCRGEVTADLENLKPLVSLPNAFSPNGDGDNDVFQAVFNCAVGFKMYIYNQWGSLIFASNSISQGWDGTRNGTEVPNGDYAFYITYDAGPEGEFQETVKGRVRLIR